MEFHKSKSHQGKSDTETYSQEVLIKMSIIVNENFTFYFLFVFATISLFSVLCSHVGAEAPRGQYAAK